MGSVYENDVEEVVKTPDQSYTKFSLFSLSIEVILISEIQTLWRTSIKRSANNKQQA